MNQIGDYKLGRTVGQGSFGKVKTGYHVKTGEKVAIKILDKSKIVDEKAKNRINREVAALHILRHPNLIRLIGVEETNENIYIITEYIAGGELFNYIQTNRFVEEKRAKKIFRDPVDTVSFIHEMGIIHRDLKPENILMDRKQGVKIIDFGLSNVIQPNEMLTSRCGSPCYVAPEIAQGKKYTESADIWSLGIILYTMLTGDTPFADDNIGQLLGKIVYGRFTMPSYLSEGAQDVLMKLLQTDPSKRVSLMDLRNHPWMLPSKYQETIESPATIAGVLDDGIIKLVQSLGWEGRYITETVPSQPHSAVSRMYRMLHARKHVRRCAFPGLANNPAPQDAVMQSAKNSPPKLSSSLAQALASSRAKVESDAASNGFMQGQTNRTPTQSPAQSPMQTTLSSPLQPIAGYTHQLNQNIALGEIFSETKSARSSRPSSSSSAGSQEHVHKQARSSRERLVDSDMSTNSPKGDDKKENPVIDNHRPVLEIIRPRSPKSALPSIDSSNRETKTIIASQDTPVNPPQLLVTPDANELEPPIDIVIHEDTVRGPTSRNMGCRSTIRRIALARSGF